MCRAGHRLVTLISRLRIHTKQVAIAELTQQKGFAVLLQVDRAVMQTATRAIAEVEPVDHATVGLIAAARHPLGRDEAQVRAEIAQRCDAFAGTDAACIADHLQGLHRQRGFQRDQLLFGHFDAEATTAVLQAQLLQTIACSGRKR